jgi:hypothetical protein
MMPETPKKMGELTLGTLTARTNIPPNQPFLAILAPCWPLKWAEMGPKINFG